MTHREKLGLCCSDVDVKDNIVIGTYTLRYVCMYKANQFSIAKATVCEKAGEYVSGYKIVCLNSNCY